MSLIKCPECGNEISSSAKTCPSCGCPVTVCPECNAVYSAEPEVCSVCGYKFRASEAEKQEQEQSDKTFKFLQNKLATNKKLDKIDSIATFVSLAIIVIVVVVVMLKLDDISQNLKLSNINSILIATFVFDLLISIGLIILEILIEISPYACKSQLEKLNIDCFEFYKQNKNNLEDKDKLETMKFAATIAYRQKKNSANIVTVFRIMLKVVRAISQSVCWFIFLKNMCNDAIYYALLGQKFNIRNADFTAIIVMVVITIVTYIIAFILKNTDKKNLEKWYNDNDLPIKFNIAGK